MSFTQILSFYCPSKIYMGIGSHREVEKIIKSWGSDRFFLTVDGALLESEIFLNIKDILDRNGISFGIFSDIEPDPSADTVAKAFEVCQQSKATALMTIGGGSAMDVAKAVGILATNGGRIHDYEGIDKFSKPSLPLIAIPTTAGTGSEVSGSCVITDTEKNLKMSIRHAALNPADVAILDPIALQTLPASVAAHSGMDAFVHVSHGLSNAICLPYAAKFNLLANPRKYAYVAQAMGENIQGLTELEAAQKGLDSVTKLCRDLGIPARLREIGATEDTLEEMSRLCVEAQYNRWNPRHTTYDDFFSLFQSAF